jgi:hypothetical protein
MTGSDLATQHIHYVCCADALITEVRLIKLSDIVLKLYISLVVSTALSTPNQITQRMWMLGAKKFHR